MLFSPNRSVTYYSFSLKSIEPSSCLIKCGAIYLKCSISSTSWNGALTRLSIPGEHFTKNCRSLHVLMAQIAWLPKKLITLSTFAAYLFTRPAKKEKKAMTREPITPAEITTPTPPAPQNLEPFFSPIPEPVKVPEPLSVKQQRSVFGWMLKEKEDGLTSKPRGEDYQWRKCSTEAVHTSRFHPENLM